MKIFNWVHRRFHHKDGYGSNEKKGNCIDTENETQSLLKNVGLANVLNGWSQGILSIGTFGFDPLDNSNPKKEESVIEENVYGEGELNDKVEDDNIQGGNLIMTVNGNVVCPYNKMKKEERITLADLLKADEGSKEIDGAEKGKIRPEPVKKTDPKKKDVVFFSKKILIPLAEASPPLHKIPRLMKRMKKKKIHPDLEGKQVLVNNGGPTPTPSVIMDGTVLGTHLEV